MQRPPRLQPDPESLSKEPGEKTLVSICRSFMHMVHAYYGIVVEHNFYKEDHGIQ